MLKSNEIFAQMPVETAGKLFSFLTEKEKPLYKATIDTLTKQRHLRPIFIERKPRVERFAWFKETLSRKTSEAVAAHLLQIWLVAEHKAVLCDFLDALGIPHENDGTVSTLPSAPPKDKLQTAVQALFDKHDPAVVAVYLHAFQAIDDKGWSSLEELLHEDDRLRLAPAPAAAS